MNVCSNPAVCYLRQIASRISRNSPYAFYGVHACYYIQIRLCVPYAHSNKSHLFLGHNNMYVSSANIPSRTLYDKRLTSHWTMREPSAPSLWQKTVYMWPMTSAFEVFARLDFHTAFVYRRFGTAETSVNKYQLTLRDELGERRLHTRRMPEISQPLLLAVTSTLVQ